MRLIDSGIADRLAAEDDRYQREGRTGRLVLEINYHRGAPRFAKLRTQAGRVKVDEDLLTRDGEQS